MGERKGGGRGGRTFSADLLSAGKDLLVILLSCFTKKVKLIREFFKKAFQFTIAKKEFPH